jgi:predicted PurR-regulated permease PerM
VQTAVSQDAWRRIITGAAVLVLLVLAWLVAIRIPRTISIFLIAAFIASAVQPICQRLEARRIPKPLAISIVFAVLILAVTVVLVIIVPLTVSQLQSLVAHLPSYISTVQAWITGQEVWLQDKIPGLHIPKNAFDIGALGSARLAGLATGTLTSLGTILVNTATAFFVAFSSIVLSFFFLLNDRQISEGIASMFPLSRRSTARKLVAEVTETFGSYISGQVILSAITGAVVAAASAIIGLKFSLILGIITAVAYAVPVIGMVVAQFIAIVLCAPQGGWMILWVQVIMFVMGRISDTLLVPKIMGESVGVSPIGVMFAVFAGGELFGIPGLLLAIPAAALIKILWRYFVAPWLRTKLDTA